MRRAGEPGDEPAGPNSIQQVLGPNPDAPTDTIHIFRRGNGNGEIITAPSFGLPDRGRGARAGGSVATLRRRGGRALGRGGEEVAEETRGRG